MIKIICNRCGADLTAAKEVGYIAMIHKTAQEKLLSGGVRRITENNPFDEDHYCENCMEEIKGFIVTAPTEHKEESVGKEKPAPREAKKGRPKTALPPAGGKKLDYGKVNALHNAGWSVSKIADEMGRSESSIHNALFKIRHNPKLIQSTLCELSDN